MELHNANQKIYMILKFYIQRLPGIKIYHPKKYKTKSLNTNLFNKIDVKT